jgi:L-alanine-DL-glutamate epimerase-like enolase superfamily enzyme
MIDGHGYWDLATAKKIARALEPYQVAWLEDLVLAHDIETEQMQNDLIEGYGEYYGA